MVGEILFLFLFQDELSYVRVQQLKVPISVLDMLWSYLLKVELLSIFFIGLLDTVPNVHC